MALPNDASTLATNGGASSPSKKKAKKSTSPLRTPEPAKSAAPKASATLEILFTQEPNPYREPQPPYIWIDFPTQNEAVRSNSYVVRLGVGGADLVEISIDKSPWLPCRLNSGYWWYDWSNISKGKHTLNARMRSPDGRWFKTPIRQCDSPR